MKKKLLALVFVSLVSIVGFGTSASAVDFSDGWVGCTPLVIGPNKGDVMVKLSCSGTEGWGMMSTTGTDQMMATFLTAMSLTKDVSVNFEGTVAETGGSFEYSKIVAVQLSM